MATFECTINIQLNPVREADNVDEFIENLINEYNTQYSRNLLFREGLFKIDRDDITKISCEDGL